ncbi:hypothetical protein ACLKA7_009443 [Drosophila subpalustris]
MKELITLALLVLAACAHPLREDGPTRLNGEIGDGWILPNRTWLGLMEAEALRETHSDVSFYLYTNNNPKEGHQLTHEEDGMSIRSSHFHPERPTKFVIHGWKGSYKDAMNKWITNAWLSRGDFNIIVVDWEASRTENYVSAAKAVGRAGSKVGEMIENLHRDFDVRLDSLEIIGHSLGAHVAGFAGKRVAQNLEQLHAIVGLDPAMPLFSWDKPEKRLASTDAFYVESIQTNGGKLGFVKPIGRGTFYPNGGKRQPGCGDDLDGLCAHTRSVTYYVEAVEQDNFGSVRCADYKAAVAMECPSQYMGVRMGAVTNAYMVKGDFYVPLNNEAPYGMIT